MTWTTNELSLIGEAEEIDIASLRADGTLRRNVTIWVVRVGNELYVRSVNGRGSGWFSGALDQHAGRITAGGVTKHVLFEEVPTSDPIHQEIDDAYLKKYAHYPQHVAPMVVPKSQEATLLLRDTGV